MFRSAAPGRERTANGFDEAMDEWRKTADNWFDGSIDSIDTRLRRCAKLTSTATAIVARSPLDSAQHYHAALEELSADRTVLSGLREDALTGGFGREAGVSPPGRTASKTVTPLSSTETRWIELESARFLHANRDVVHESEELSERARHHAMNHGPSQGFQRAKIVADAFTSKVAALGRATPRPRLAAARPPRADFADSLLFVD